MITSARFVNVRGAQIALNDNNIPFQRFVMETEVRKEQVEKAREHGYWPSPSYFGHVAFHCEGDLLADDSAEYMNRRKDLVTAILPHPHLGYMTAGTLYIVFDGITEELASECSPESWEIPIEALSPARGRYILNFKSDDPRLFGPRRSTDVFGAAAPSGRTYPKTYPKTYPAGGTPSEILVTNSGNIETYPIVVLFGPGNVPTVYLKDPLGVTHTVAINLTLNSTSEYVTIDFARRTAIRHTGEDVYGLVTASKWTPLEPGDTLIKYAGAGTFAPAKATVFWKNAYIL